MLYNRQFVQIYIKNTFSFLNQIVKEKIKLLMVPLSGKINMLDK